jgi:hypothetical protein
VAARMAQGLLVVPPAAGAHVKVVLLGYKEA